jgi:hypothetical protein
MSPTDPINATNISCPVTIFANGHIPFNIDRIHSDLHTSAKKNGEKT